MKKLSYVLSILFVAFLLTGCGASPKEEAKSLNDKYSTQMDKLWEDFGDFMENSFEKYGITIEADAYIGKNMKPFVEKRNNIKEQLLNEKVLKENEALKESLNKRVTSMIDLFSLVSDLSDDPDKNQALSPKLMDSMKEFLKSIFAFKNEYSKLTTGQSLYVPMVENEKYYGEYVSNVGIAIYKIEKKDSLGADSYFMKKPLGKFIIVSAVITNNQKDAITIDSSSFKLVDKNKNEFSTSVEGMSVLQMSEGHTKGFLTKLNPTMTITISLVFDVPVDAKEKDFSLQAQGGFSGDKVNLPLQINKLPD